MAISIQPPLPGDLITASFMKQLIDQLIAFDKRLASLEVTTPGAGGSLAIVSLSASDLNLGDELRIFGVNFGLPSENVVTFSGLEAVSQFKPGSNDKLLILDVPALSFLGDVQVFEVEVSNPRGFGSKSLTVHKPAPTLPGGTVLLGFDKFPPGSSIKVPPTGSANYTFEFHIEGRGTMDETYDVTPTFPPGWNAVLVTDASGTNDLPQAAGGSPPPPWRMAIPAPPPGQLGVTVPLFVRLTIPSTADPTKAGNVGLKAASVHNPMWLKALPVSVDFPLNGDVPNAQTLTFGQPKITGPNSQSVVDPTFSVPTTTSQPLNVINLAVSGMGSDTYQVNLGWEDGDSKGWTASLGGTPQSQGWPILQSPGPFLSGSAVRIVLTAIGTAGQANLLVTVQKLPVTSPVTKSTDYGIAKLTLVPVLP